MDRGADANGERDHRLRVSGDSRPTASRAGRPTRRTAARPSPGPATEETTRAATWAATTPSRVMASSALGNGAPGMFRGKAPAQPPPPLPPANRQIVDGSSPKTSDRRHRRRRADHPEAAPADDWARFPGTCTYVARRGQPADRVQRPHGDGGLRQRPAVRARDRHRRPPRSSSSPTTGGHDVLQRAVRVHLDPGRVPAAAPARPGRPRRIPPARRTRRPATPQLPDPLTPAPRRPTERPAMTALINPTAPGEQEIAAFGRLHQRTRRRRRAAVHGKRAVVDLVLVATFAGGHVLLEDVPGTGKTTLARAIARAMGGQVGRDPVHPRPAAERRHRHHGLRPARRPGPVPPGPGVRQRRPRRRDQPGRGQDPVGAARGDGGAHGHRRRRRPPGAARRSWSSRRRTRSTSRAPTGSPRPSSTGS